MIEVMYRGEVHTIYLTEELFEELKKLNPDTAFTIYDSNGNRRTDIKIKFLTVKEKGGKGCM